MGYGARRKFAVPASGSVGGIIMIRGGGPLGQSPALGPSLSKSTGRTAGGSILIRQGFLPHSPLTTRRESAIVAVHSFPSAKESIP